MRSNHLVAVAALVSVFALIGCDKARPLPAPADPTRGCLSCHGGQDNQTGAPPWSLPRNAAGAIAIGGAQFTNENTQTAIEVGAHTRHISRGVSCGACHVVPASITSPGHNTSQRATVTFKELAAAGNVIPPEWVPAVHTCTNYCHGISLGHGGTNHAPDWLGGAPAGACGTCHFGAGVTPPAQHPQGPGGAGYADTTACADCHLDTVNAADGTINVGGGKHVNGQLDGGGGHSPNWADPANHGPAATGGLQGCTVCHGTDFNGGTAGVSCNACHTANGHPSWQTECIFCHGSATRAADATFPNAGSGTVVRANLAAPPVGSQGENTITAYAVGAHEAHVGGTSLARPAQCFDCHGPTLPTNTAHVNGTVVVGWSATASNGIAPTPAAGDLARWNDATLPAGGANCTNFCHGATLAGGTHTSPRWNEGATGATCGSCHAIPLPYTAAGGWHVPRSDCGTCHPGYTSSSVSVTDHVFVGAGPSGLTCHSCHGSATNDAPPSDITGATSGGNAIGAHQKHVATLTLHQGGFTCTECHADNTGNLRHANGSINILWGATAAAGGYAVTPASGGFTPGAAFPTCTNYCHLPRAGDTAAGLVKTPLWSATGNIVCGSCHGLPPAGTGHTTSTACSSCHDGYADAPSPSSLASAVSLTNHLNGVVNVANLSCTSCHGTAGRSSVAGADPLQPVAPPAFATTAAAVGAHLAHVNQGDTAAPGPLSSPLACLNCHTGLIPATAPHTYPANPVAFGNLAIAASASPGPYVQATQTCASTYCHGQFAGGTTGNSVTWGAAGKLACNACHGQSVAAPQPTYPHPQNTGCGSCHAGYASATVAAATHVDGLITKSTAGCTACHGDRSDTAVTLTTSTVKAAPGATGTATSADTTGATATTAPGVGAHRAHLVGAGGTPRWRSTPVTCTECHALPASNTDTAHATGVGTGVARATLTFGALAGDTAFETKTPGYTQPTCSSVYCHDPRSTDTAAGQANAPAWNGATTLAQCGSCHGLPPATAAHPTPVTECGSCHGGYSATMPTSASTIAAVNALSHINGQLDGGGDCISCHTGTQGTRRPIVPEFAQAWSHKRSAGGAVTKWDCVVCHMEGDAATGDPSAVHKDGVINLRDPDTGANIKGVTFGGTGAGSYTTTATDATFTQFSRNLGSATLEPAVQAIMINQCLKCHDGNGAVSPLARVPTTGTAEKPFGTTIAGAGYTGVGITANGVLGGVADVNESFKTTNSSYHPVTGKQNNWYAKLTRMAAPWNAATRGASVDLTSWGPLLSCWDCHSDPADTGVITRTVTAHGGINTLRGVPTVTGTPSTTNKVTLCTRCHTGYDTSVPDTDGHGAGSAITTGVDNSMNDYMNFGCNICHGSKTNFGTITVPRPTRAQDVHGVNALPVGGLTPTTGTRWATAGALPYAFIRNTQLLKNHQPAKIGATTWGGSCVMGVSPCGTDRTKTYTVGGTY